MIIDVLFLFLHHLTLDDCHWPLYQGGDKLFVVAIAYLENYMTILCSGFQLVVYFVISVAI